MVSAGAILVGLASVTWSRDASAQACCAGSAAATPARLGLHEDALIGLAMRAAGVHGSFTSAGDYRANPARTSETDLEQDLFAALRVLDRGQASLLVPLIETRRTVPGTAEVGAGLGDVVLGGRWDVTLMGASTSSPGIGLLAGLTLPTGRPVDAAKKPLATDATGTGAFAGALGLGLEQRFERVYVGLLGTFAYRASRTTQQIREQLAPLWTTQLAVAWLPGDAAIGLAFAGSFEGDATIDGTRAPGTGRRTTTASIIGATPFAGAWRAQGALFATPPISGAGVNQTASYGLQLAGIYTWM